MTLRWPHLALSFAVGLLCGIVLLDQVRQLDEPRAEHAEHLALSGAPDEHLHSAARSSKWPAVRAAHLKLHPVCEVCGGNDFLEVHHKTPFHDDPANELDPDNLITLCRHPGHNCHFFVGHLLDYQASNPHVEDDARFWRERILSRRYK